MTKRNKRMLENAGQIYQTPVSLYTQRPDTTINAVPNLNVYGLGNTNGFAAQIGRNINGDLVDYRTGNYISEEDAKARMKAVFVDPAVVRRRQILDDMRMDKYRRNKKYK